MTQTAEQPYSYEVSDAPNLSAVSDIAEKIAWFERQLAAVSTDERSLLKDEQSRFIEGLLAENPAELIARSLHEMSAEYAGRAKRTELEDGTCVLSWGTRDASYSFLNYTYHIATEPTGEVTYLVDMREGDKGRTVLRVQGDDMTATNQSKPRHAFEDSVVAPLGDNATHDAATRFVHASMVAFSKLAERDDHDAKFGLHGGVSWRGKADAMAGFLLDDTDVTRQLPAAQSETDIELLLETSLHASSEAWNGPSRRERYGRIMAMLQR